MSEKEWWMAPAGQAKAGGTNILRMIFSGASGKVPPDDTLPPDLTANRIVSGTCSWV
jgi:hypothetical protein